MMPEQFIDASDDQVLVISLEGGRGKGSGAEVETHPTVHLWTLSGGLAWRRRICLRLRNFVLSATFSRR